MEWGVRVAVVVLVAFQWVPVAGGLAVPIMRDGQIDFLGLPTTTRISNLVIIPIAYLWARFDRGGGEEQRWGPPSMWLISTVRLEVEQP
jgi:hypothetical protein